MSRTIAAAKSLAISFALASTASTTALTTTALTSAVAASPAQAADPKLNIETIAVTSAATGGSGSTRGPALTIFDNGEVLLGGGKSGGTIFTFDPATKSLKPLGSLIAKGDRPNDSRFAITDIAILSQTPTSARLLASYPRLGKSKDCVEVLVDELSLNRATNKLTRVSNWFTSKPCVPISAPQHAAGRLLAIDENSAYLTIGDLGYPEINNRAKRGDLGKTFRITKSKTTEVSQGHRNAQGILIDDAGRLLVSEHGPRGGDELNLITQGRDYGWPFVTFGEPYSAGDYVIPEKTGTTAGYQAPLYYWVPSVAPTALVQVPRNTSSINWGKWAGQLLMGTLREESLIRINLDANNKVRDTQVIKVGQRLRDMEFDGRGRLLVTTDDGGLLVITPRA
jgi:glucose/arabinose dehydrogenase